MSRALWNGWISFGLVNVPVKLFNAVKKKTVNFHQLRTTDGCRIRQKKVCSTDGTPVTAENIVKGFEVSPDNYVVVTDKELEVLSPEANRYIEIKEFVNTAEIDPMYFRQHYYLLPESGATRAYGLLLAALRQSGKAAVAQFVMRRKELLAVLRPAGQVLSLSAMFFADEIVPVADLTDLPDSKPELTERDVTMAEQLIESLKADFEPQKYHNQYYSRLMELIERKANGEAPAQTPSPEEGARTIDLSAALEASLAAIKKRPPPRDRRKMASGH